MIKKIFKLIFKFFFLCEYPNEKDLCFFSTLNSLKKMIRKFKNFSFSSSSVVVVILVHTSKLKIRENHIYKDDDDVVFLCCCSCIFSRLSFIRKKNVDDALIK